MCAHQAHGFALVFFVAIQKKGNFAALHHRNFKLADLIALGQIGVEIILAGKNAARRNMRTQRQPQFDGAGHRFAVHDRQRAGQGHVHHAGLRVGRGAKSRGCAAEYLAFGLQLGVRFKADDDFVALDELGGLRHFGHSPQNPPGRCVCQSVASWNWCAAASRRLSCK